MGTYCLIFLLADDSPLSVHYYDGVEYASTIRAGGCNLDIFEKAIFCLLYCKGALKLFQGNCSRKDKHKKKADKPCQT